MNALVLMLLHVLAAVLISAMVLMYLKPALNRMIHGLCSNATDEDFWQRYTVVMMVITPVIMMLMFSDGRSFMNFGDADELRVNMLLVLLGQFLGLAVVGRTLWKTTKHVIGMDAQLSSDHPHHNSRPQSHTASENK